MNNIYFFKKKCKVKTLGADNVEKKEFNKDMDELGV